MLAGFVVSWGRPHKEWSVCGWTYPHYRAVQKDRSFTTGLPGLGRWEKHGETSLLGRN